MDGYWLQLALVAVLVVVNSVFAGSEIALISLREGQLRRLDRQGGAGRAVTRLARDPNRFLATIQIGITLAGFLASATAAVALAEPLVPLLASLGAAAAPVAVVLVTLVLTFLTLVFGELAPKRVAMQRAESWALLVARPLGVLSVLSRPVVWALGKATDLAVRLMGGDPARQREEMTPHEIRDLVAAHRGFSPEQRLIISGAVEISERLLREILVPRREVYTLEADTSREEACALLAASGHLRAPVVTRGTLDDAIGIVTLRDLVLRREAATVAGAVRPALSLPGSLKVSDALRCFTTEREQFALVVDELGSVDGIVTLEDCLEEVVGEIYDETDRDVVAVHRPGDGSLVVPGAFPVHDLADLGVEVPSRPGGDYTTIAGLILALLGRLPGEPGEAVVVDGWRLEILSIDHHAITQVRLRPLPPHPGRPPRS